METSPAPTSSISNQPIPSINPISQRTAPLQSQKGHRLLWLFVALIILFGAGYFAYGYYQKNLVPPASSTPPFQPSSNPSPSSTSSAIPADWKTYKNEQYGLEFKYPKNLQQFETKDADKVVKLTMIPVCEPVNLISCLYLSNETLNQTNFKGAGLSVNSHWLLKGITKEQCDKEFIPEAQKVSVKEINGVEYRVYTHGGAAAGNQNIDRTYITFQNDQCIQITQRITMDSSDVNVPGEKVKTFTEEQKNDIFSMFDQVLSTFKFLGNGADISKDWKIYSSSKYNFSIKYPVKIDAFDEEWVFQEAITPITGSEIGFGFGPPSSKSGGYVWGVWIHTEKGPENLISQVGKQFKDRKETREKIIINGLSATLVTVTTNEVNNWIAKNVYITQSLGGQLTTYVIGNGAVNLKEFDYFYNSFRFIN